MKTSWRTFFILLSMGFLFNFASPATAQTLEPPTIHSTQDFPAADMTGLRSISQGPLEIWYPPEAEKAAQNLLESGQAHKTRIWRSLGLSQNNKPIRVMLLDDLNNYFARRDMSPRAPLWAVGLAMSQEDTVLVKWGRNATGQWVNLDTTLAHELAHIGLDRATNDHSEHIDGHQRVTHSHARLVPRWLHEGFAIAQAQEWNLQRETTLLEASLTDNIMPLQSLHRGFPPEGPRVELAYAEGYHFVRHLQTKWGELAFAELLRHMRDGETFDTAFVNTYGKRFSVVEREWRRDLNVAYTWFPVLTGSSVFWGFGGLLFLVAWYRKRKQAKARLANMAKEEALNQGPRIPLPGLGLTVEHTLPQRPIMATSSTLWDRDGVFISTPHLHTLGRDPDTPCNADGHTLH